MTYQNLETKGTITEIVGSPQHVTRSNPQLHSPDEVYLTRVWIDQRPDRNGATCTELFGYFGSEYVGREIRLIQSYDKPKPGLRRFTQQIFIDGKLEVDQAIVKRV